MLTCCSRRKFAVNNFGTTTETPVGKEYSMLYIGLNDVDDYYKVHAITCLINSSGYWFIKVHWLAGVGFYTLTIETHIKEGLNDYFHA